MTKYIKTVTVTDPDTNNPVEVEIRKDDVSGAMVGIDGSYLENTDGDVYNPYNFGEVLEIPDDEAPSPQGGGLKQVLMEMGNKLVTEHGFEPGSQRVAIYHPQDRRTSVITLFTEFVNFHHEVQQVLTELGFAWPVAVPKKVYTREEADNMDYLSPRHGPIEVEESDDSHK